MSRRRVCALAVAAAALGMIVAVAAQGGGGQRGGGAARGGGAGGGGFQMPTRLSMLTSAFKLDKAQVPAVKTTLDEAAKDPAVVAVRTELATAHAAIGAEIEKGASPDAIDAAVKAYAAVSQKMASLELTTLAKVMKSLNETQRGNPTATTAAVALMRGAFVDKKWDVTPGTTNY